MADFKEQWREETPRKKLLEDTRARAIGFAERSAQPLLGAIKKDRRLFDTTDKFIRNVVTATSDMNILSLRGEYLSSLSKYRSHELTKEKQSVTISVPQMDVVGHKRHLTEQIRLLRMHQPPGVKEFLYAISVMQSRLTKAKTGQDLSRCYGDLRDIVSRWKIPKE
jgi:hypothetical protein